MRAVPKYNVVYKGVMRPGGVPFEIDDADADEMRSYCALQSSPVAAPTETPAEAETEQKPKTRTRKKASEE